MRLVVFSDVHIGGKFNEEMFRKGVDIINSTEADYYLFTGDLTDQGTLHEYKSATEKYLPLIKKPVLYIPGNHDVKNVGDLLWEEFIGPRYFLHNDLDKKVKILGLDSNEPDKNTGRIGEGGIKRIYQEFEGLDDEWVKILAFHHQTLPIRYTGRERSAITDAGDVIKAILDTNVDMVINGHRHISNVYLLSDSDYSTLVVNCGTMSCKKTRYKEEYSVTVIDYDRQMKEAVVKIVKLNETPPRQVTRYTGKTNLSLAPDRVKGMTVPTSRIIQIGNTEFSYDTFDAKAYAKAVTMLNFMNCDLVIHCGDVTNSSFMEEFEMAQVYLNQIKHDMLIVPGPRDYYPLGYEMFRKTFGTTNPMFENTTIKVLGINTCILDESEGRLGRSSLRRIREELSHTNKNSVVAFHHTLIPLPRTRHSAELQDAGDTMAFLIGMGVNLVLTGSKNTSGCWRVGDTIFSNCGTIASKNITSSKGNSFNIIDIYEKPDCKVIVVSEFFVNTGLTQEIGRFLIEKGSKQAIESKTGGVTESKESS